jgi:hypothetical protein
MRKNEKKEQERERNASERSALVLLVITLPGMSENVNGRNAAASRVA